MGSDFCIRMPKEVYTALSETYEFREKEYIKGEGTKPDMVFVYLDLYSSNSTIKIVLESGV